MKKVRCPRCGEECLDTWDRLSAWMYRNRRNRLWGKRGASCRKCDGVFISQIRRPLSVPAKGVYALFFLLSLLFLVLSCRISPWFVIPALLTTLIIMIHDLYSGLRRSGIVQFDQDKQTAVLPEENATVSLDTENPPICNLDIYGLRFSAATRFVRFQEAFRDGLVPAVFLREPEESGKSWRIALMNTVALPDSLMKEGIPFSVVDNGAVIAQGRLSSFRREPPEAALP